MTVSSLGSLTLAVAVPGAATANVALGIACGIAAPNVSAQLTAVASFAPSVSLSFVDMLALAHLIVDNIEAAIAAIPPIPVLSLSAQVALAASIVSSLTTTLLVIQAQVAIQLSLAGILATGGVSAYAFDGARNVFGTEMATSLGVSAVHANALVLMTTSGATWTVMGQLFKTS